MVAVGSNVNDVVIVLDVSSFILCYFYTTNVN